MEYGHYIVVSEEQLEAAFGPTQQETHITNIWLFLLRVNRYFLKILINLATSCREKNLPQGKFEMKKVRF
jgi:hypothetical protein